MNISLIVFFEDPFWVGVFERNYDGIYEVSRIVFGSEPKDFQVYELILENFYKIKFSSPIKEEQENVKKKLNPKRLKKKIQQQVEEKGIGTKAQNALKKEFENMKLETKAVSKLRKEEEEKIKFNLRQEKKKQKKRGH